MPRASRSRASNPDYYALQLGSAVLGGGFYSSRLSIDLRKEAGLVYSVGSNLQAGRTRGVYIIDFASDPQNVAKAAAMAIRTEGPAGPRHPAPRSCSARRR